MILKLWKEIPECSWALNFLSVCDKVITFQGFWKFSCQRSRSLVLFQLIQSDNSNISFLVTVAAVAIWFKENTISRCVQPEEKIAPSDVIYIILHFYISASNTKADPLTVVLALTFPILFSQCEQFPGDNHGQACSSMTGLSIIVWCDMSIVENNHMEFTSMVLSSGLPWHGTLPDSCYHHKEYPCPATMFSIYSHHLSPLCLPVTW